MVQHQIVADEEQLSVNTFKGSISTSPVMLRGLFFALLAKAASVRENERMKENPYQSPEPTDRSEPTSPQKPVPVSKVAFSVLTRLLGLYVLVYGIANLAHGIFLGLGGFEIYNYSPAEYCLSGSVELVLGFILLFSAPSIAQTVFGRFDW